MPDWVKRASNRDNSANILAGRRIRFESNNNGAHLVIKHTVCDDCSHIMTDHEHEYDKDCACGGRWTTTVVDFWPGTGKWIVRGTNVEGRGVFNLLTKLGVRHI